MQHLFENRQLSQLLQPLLLPCLRILRFGRRGSSRQNGSEVITMQGQTGQVPAVAEAATSVDARISLLAEVDFKWLMAGQGCWIDTNRFHSDPAYVAGLIRVALASQSFALRECAASLQAQLSGVTSCDVEGLAPDQSPSRQSSIVASARNHEMR